MDAAVIKLVPLAGLRVLAKRSVVPTPQRAVVIRYCEQIVDLRLTRGSNHVLTQIEALNREVDKGLELVAVVLVLVAEALQMHHQHWGQLPQVKLLRRLSEV